MSLKEFAVRSQPAGRLSKRGGNAMIKENVAEEKFAHDRQATKKARLAEFVAGLSQRRSSDWAWEHYKDTVEDLIKLLDARRVMEIGGGRWPLLNQDEIASSNIRYVVNDISDSELALAPAHVDKARFDIAQTTKLELEVSFGQIDLMFSQMVFEHVSDVHQAYRNIHKILSPGGVCLNFHPVLYSPPFVINWMLPDSMSARLLRMFFPNRHKEDVPKHPAKYDHCLISRREENAMRSMGYSEVWQIPFWSHDYFKKIPGVYQLDSAVSRIAERNNWATLASFCYTLVVK